MNVLLFGASGMIGDGVLHECLADDRATSVLAIVRSPVGIDHPKLRQHRQSDFFDYAALSAEFTSIDACFFCLGVSSFRMTEADYQRVTYDLTLAAATALAAARPGATFCYISGEGTDPSECGRSMWARVKGRTENALLRLPLEAYMLRPGFVRPRRGKKSKTRLYRAVYAVLWPLFPLLQRIAPRHVTTVENVGRAMIELGNGDYDQPVLENADINELAARAARVYLRPG